MNTRENVSKDSVLMSVLLVVFMGCIGMGVVSEKTADAPDAQQSAMTKAATAKV